LERGFICGLWLDLIRISGNEYKYARNVLRLVCEAVSVVKKEIKMTLIVYIYLKY